MPPRARAAPARGRAASPARPGHRACADAPPSARPSKARLQAAKRERALFEFKARLDEEDFVTITVHNDDLLWAKMLRAAVHAGFTPVPGSMLMSIVNPTQKGMVVTHVAHMLRAEQPEETPARPAPAATPLGAEPYEGPEFG